jgi:2'-5' RNA ligase
MNLAEQLVTAFNSAVFRRNSALARRVAVRVQLAKAVRGVLIRRAATPSIHDPRRLAEFYASHFNALVNSGLEVPEADTMQANDNLAAHGWSITWNAGLSQWEVDGGERYDFSSTQVNLPPALARRIAAFARRIKPHHLAEKGIERESHITLKYGLHTGNVEDVRHLLAGAGPITVTLGATSIFPSRASDVQRGGSAYDVLKIDVDSPELHRLNQVLHQLPHTDSFPVYQPHVTIGYLKPGVADAYTGSHDFMGRRFVIDRVHFSSRDGTHSTIRLGTHRSPAGGVRVGKRRFGGGQFASCGVLPKELREAIEAVTTH